ncbi:MAG: 7-cyano-7-deazaguanine synthase, partial [Phenylobacterium sp.]|nr:7-cyano-7-deazaguanine synthase [Phenylobacterium sp.]
LVELIRAETLTCYKGEVGALNDWGRGCGECPACELRRSGFERWRAT